LLCDHRTLKHLNLPEKEGFRWHEVNTAEELSKIRLDLSNGAIFVATGVYDFSTVSSDFYEKQLGNFIKMNHATLKRNQLVYIKPRIKPKYTHEEKQTLSKFIGIAFSKFMAVNAETTMLTMENKPKIVDLYYRSLFKNIFKDKPIKKDEPVIKPIIPVEKEIDLPKPIPRKPSNVVHDLWFSGHDFQEECSIELFQNDIKIGETEKYKFKDNENHSPFFKKGIKVSVNSGLDENLLFKFGKWGYLNITLNDIFDRKVFPINSKKGSGSRVSITATKPDTKTTSIHIAGRDFKKGVDCYLKVYECSKQQLIYQSEVVKNDSTPHFKKFEIVDARFDVVSSQFNIEVFDKDTIKDDYLGFAPVDYRDLKRYKNFKNSIEVKDEKSATRGVLMLNVEQSGISGSVKNLVYDDTKNYHVYFKVKDTKKGTKYLKTKVMRGPIEQHKHETEKIEAESAGYRTSLFLPNITEKASIDFVVESNKDEAASISFQKLLLASKTGKKLTEKFGEGEIDFFMVEDSRNKMYEIEVEVEKLPKMDGLLNGGKADPFFILKLDGYTVYKSEVVKNKLEAKFKFKLPSHLIEQAETYQIEFYDHDTGNADDPIGQYYGPVNSIGEPQRLEQFAGGKVKDLDRAKFTMHLRE